MISPTWFWNILEAKIRPKSHFRVIVDYLEVYSQADFWKLKMHSLFLRNPLRIFLLCGSSSSPNLTLDLLCFQPLSLFFTASVSRLRRHAVLSTATCAASSSTSQGSVRTSAPPSRSSTPWLQQCKVRSQPKTQALWTGSVSKLDKRLSSTHQSGTTQDPAVQLTLPRTTRRLKNSS